jgi:ABC-2 type transport system ATP-binding protein
VLLSSHVLSEVEALCDRVAILREGELADLGTMAELRHLSALDINITFRGPRPDLSSVTGLEVVSVDDETITGRLTGSMEPLLKALAPFHVVQLLSREPSLEELFLAHYGSTPRSGQVGRGVA